MATKVTIFIASLVLGVLLLLIISSNFTNNKIENAEKERKNKNILQEIIDSTANQNNILNKSVQGKVIVLNIWATWCAPCLKEIPDLNKLVQDFSNDNILFIALNDRDSTAEEGKMKSKNISFNYQLEYDQKDLIDLIHSFKLEHESMGLPLNIVINEDGGIEIFYIGYNPKKLQSIRDYLSSLERRGQI